MYVHLWNHLHQGHFLKNYLKVTFFKSMCKLIMGQTFLNVNIYRTNLILTLMNKLHIDMFKTHGEWISLHYDIACSLKVYFTVWIPSTITRPAKVQERNWYHSWWSNILFFSATCNISYYQFIVCIIVHSTCTWFSLMQLDWFPGNYVPLVTNQPPTFSWCMIKLVGFKKNVLYIY